MSKLEQLPEISESLLSGLRADETLKYRILQNAVETPSPAVSHSSRRPLVALISLSVAMIAVFVMLGTVHPGSLSSVSASQPESFSDQIHTITAGGRRADSPIDLGLIIDETFSEEKTEEETEEAEKTPEPPDTTEPVSDSVD